MRGRREFAFSCTRALETHTTARQSDEHYSKVGAGHRACGLGKKLFEFGGEGVQTTVCNCQRGTQSVGFFCLVLFAISASHCPFGSTKRRV